MGDNDQPDKGVEGGTPGPSGEPQSQMHEVVINGQKSEVALDKLISSFQQDSVHTQKFQGLADDRKRFDSMVHDKAAELAAELLQGEGKGNGQEPSREPDAEEQALGRLKVLEDRLNSTEQMVKDKESDSELQRLMGTLKGEFKHMDKDKVLIRFHNEAHETDDPVAKIKEFAKESHDSYLTNRQSIIDEYIKEKSQPPQAIGETGHSTGTPSKPPEVLKTFDQARERMEKRFDGMR